MLLNYVFRDNFWFTFRQNSRVGRRINVVLCNILSWTHSDSEEGHVSRWRRPSNNCLVPPLLIKRVQGWFCRREGVKFFFYRKNTSNNIPINKDLYPFVEVNTIYVGKKNFHSSIGFLSHGHSLPF